MLMIAESLFWALVIVSTVVSIANYIRTIDMVKILCKQEPGFFLIPLITVLISQFMVIKLFY